MPHIPIEKQGAETATLRRYRSAAKRVEQDLRARIGVGAWESGALLPGRRQIAAEYGVDVNTLQRAMEPLIAERLLRVDIGRGTFISAAPAPQATRATSPAAQPAKTEHTTPVTLGIIAGHSLETSDRSQNADLWDYIIVHGLESEFSARTPMLSHYSSLSPTERGIVSLAGAMSDLLASGADALALVLPMERIERDVLLAAVETVKVPLVVATFQELALPVPQISYDSRFAGHQSARHLIEQGYHDLLFFSPFGAAWVSERLEGARDALQLAGMPANILTVAPIDHDVDPLMCDQETLARIAAAESMPWLRGTKASAAAGVIAANDAVASGFMKAAGELGWTAGQDYGIVGFDDRPLARSIGLTSLHPPIEEMGREAARQLIRALAGEEMPMQVRLRSHLMARKSSRRIG